MPDVIALSYPSSTPSVSGRTVSRIPTSISAGPAIFALVPQVNRQAQSGVFDQRYTNRFDDVGYYFT